MKSSQIVVSRPAGFDLSETLKCAKSVKLDMAFAKKSGWALIKEALLSGKAEVQIVVGLNFGITDPDLLSEWLELSAKTPHFKVRVAPEKPTFHPKLMIIESGSFTCAIVDSGNLTGGGQLHNVECGVYISRDEEIKELKTWFNTLRSVPLEKEIIDGYRPVYRAFRKAQEESEVASSGLTAALNPDGSGWYPFQLSRNKGGVEKPLHQIRKTASIEFRCMEDHGAPRLISEPDIEDTGVPTTDDVYSQVSKAQEFGFSESAALSAFPDRLKCPCPVPVVAAKSSGTTTACTQAPVLARNARIQMPRKIT